MSEIVDISLPLHPGMVLWPGSVGFRLTRTMRLEAGEEANVSRLDCDVHAGTHVDAPWHFLEGGGTVERMPLDDLIGPAVVADTAEADAITADVLGSMRLPPKTERLLLRTRNSRLYTGGADRFTEDYTALTPDAARWLVDQGIRLVGIDYLSVERFESIPVAHRILLEANVVILEGLSLAHVEPGMYELICLPLRLVGAEAAPARAVLRPLPVPGGVAPAYGGFR